MQTLILESFFFCLWKQQQTDTKMKQLPKTYNLHTCITVSCKNYERKKTLFILQTDIKWRLQTSGTWHHVVWQKLTNFWRNVLSPYSTFLLQGTRCRQLTNFYPIIWHCIPGDSNLHSQPLLKECQILHQTDWFNANQASILPTASLAVTHHFVWSKNKAYSSVHMCAYIPPNAKFACILLSQSTIPT